MKVVFDTNIFISAFVIPGGKAEEVYLHVLKGDFDLYSSVAILTETAQKLREKFAWPENQIIRLLKAISKVATVIKTRSHLHILADEPDNRILECALEAKVVSYSEPATPKSKEHSAHHAGTTVGQLNNLRASPLQGPRHSGPP